MKGGDGRFTANRHVQLPSGWAPRTRVPALCPPSPTLSPPLEKGESIRVRGKIV